MNIETETTETTPKAKNPLFSVTHQQHKRTWVLTKLKKPRRYVTCYVLWEPATTSVHWRVKDDDGEIYAKGEYFAAPDVDNMEFKPFEHFSAWGVTSIEYSADGGPWEVL